MATQTTEDKQSWLDNAFGYLEQALQFVVDLGWWSPVCLWGILAALSLASRGYLPEGILHNSVADLSSGKPLASVFKWQWNEKAARRFLTAPVARDNPVKIVDGWLASLYGDELIGPKLFDRALLYAAFYPVVCLVIVWVFTGSIIGLGNPEFDDDWGLLYRFVGLLNLAGIVGFTVWAFNGNAGWLKKVVVTCFVLVFSYTTDSSFAAGVLGVVVGAVIFVASSFGSAIFVAGIVGGMVISMVIGILDIPGSTGASFAASILFLTAFGAVATKLKRKALDASMNQRIVIMIALLIMLALFVAFGRWVLTIDWVTTNSKSVIVSLFILTYFAALPLWNALLDTISVAITRSLLGSYTAGKTGSVRMALTFAVDFLAAIILTLILYWGTVQLLILIEPIPSPEGQAAFIQSLTTLGSPESYWVFAMAFTNFLPTLLHLAGQSSGKCLGVLQKKYSVNAAARQTLFEDTPTASNSVGATPVVTVSRTEALSIMRWVYLDRYLSATFPVVLVIAAIPHAVALTIAFVSWTPSL